MEPASLALGIVSLAGLFQSCFNMLETICTIKAADSDLAEVQSQLSLEKLRLKYMKKKYDAGTVNQDAEECMAVMQEKINSCVNKIQKTVLKYSGGSRRPKRIATWIARDNELLKNELRLLQHYCNASWQLVTTEAERTRQDYLTRATTVSTTDYTALTKVAAMPPEQFPGIVKAAKVKLLLQSMNSISGSEVTRTNNGGQSSFRVSSSSMQWEQTPILTHGSYTPALLYDTSGIAATEIPVIVEWRGAFMGSNVQTVIDNRLDELCRLLNAMNTVNQTSDSSHLERFTRNTDFGMLRCRGWTSTPDSSYDNIGLIFQYPHRDKRPPETLQKRIADTRPQRKPALGDRFDLAFGILNAIANIICVGWMHRAIRSDNMLVFDQDTIRNVYLIGFTFARPGVSNDHDSSQEFSDLPSNRGALLYRPPRNVGKVNSFDDVASDDDQDDFNASQEGLCEGHAAHDMYALGIILVEIGLWDTIENLKNRRKGMNMETFQTQGLKELIPQLRWRCGNVYTDVVEKCLDVSNWDRDTLTDNLGDILGRLKQCRA